MAGIVYFYLEEKSPFICPLEKTEEPKWLISAGAPTQTIEIHHKISCMSKTENKKSRSTLKKYYKIHS